MKTNGEVQLRVTFVEYLPESSVPFYYIAQSLYSDTFHYSRRFPELRPFCPIS